MKEVLLVAFGGAVGSVARFKVSGWLLPVSLNWRFPLPTFAINLVGCLVIGLLAGLVEKRDLITPEWRLLLFTGLLGGFTTFSAFGLETLTLLRRGEFAVAGSYVLLSVGFGVALCWLGFVLAPCRD